MKTDKKGWVLTSLGDVCVKKEEIDREGASKRVERFIKVEHLDADSLHIKRWGNVGEDELPPTFFKIFRKGQMLFPTRNPHLRRAALASFDGICGEKTLTLEPKLEVVTAEFFPFIFSSEAFTNHTTSAIIGSTNPHVRWRDVAEFKFLLPPKEQQIKLAELLWAGNSVTEKYHKLKLDINDIIKATGKSLIEKAKKNTTLGRIIQLRKGKKPSVFLEKDEKYLPYLSTDFLRVDAETGYVNPLIEKNILICEKGNILILWDGSNAGEIFKSKKGVVSSTMAVVIIKDKSYLEDFLYYILHFNSEKIRSGNTGSAIPHVSQDILYGLNIPVVSEKEQQIWIKKLSELFETKLAVEKMINESSQIQVQLINQIFPN